MEETNLQSQYNNLGHLFRWLIILVSTVIMVFVVTFFAFDYVYANKVFPNVIFLDINLSGLTYGEVLEAVDSRIDTTDIAPLQLEFEGSLWDINPNEFGFEIDINVLATQALATGRQSNIIDKVYKRGLSIFGVKQPVISRTDLVETFDKEILLETIQLIAGEINQEGIDAVFISDDKDINKVSEFTISQPGQELNINETILLIAQNILNPTRQIKLPVQITAPKTTLADTNDLGVDVLIARGISDFSGSPRNRRHNIATGATRFDGVLIKPNETFSFLKILGSVNSRTGYLPELVIKGDETIPEYGGGLCQVSTTAFRAILNGGLPVDARRNHSYRVFYYEPAGTDATIYQPYPDLKFTNDTDGYIMMDTYIDGNQLFFDFYGTETGRDVRIDGPRIYNVTAYPEPVYIDTSTLPVDEIKQVDSAHRGADAVLNREVYDENGKLLFKDTFNSHYIPWPAKYLRGVEEAPSVEADLDNILPEESASEDAKIDPINVNEE